VVECLFENRVEAVENRADAWHQRAGLCSSTNHQVSSASLRIPCRSCIGRTSVVFGFGLFLPEREGVATTGSWVQVYIDRETRRPVPIPERVLQPLQAAAALRATPADPYP
jgi:hypothetical protein